MRSLDSYFFGQETKYRKRNKKFVTDYFQRSAYFPQQTTILGMLRYYLLMIKGQIPITDKIIAEEQIGANSFEYDNRSQTFGKIEKISPIYIYDDVCDHFYLPNPLDVIKNDFELKNLKLTGQKDSEKILPKTNLHNGSSPYFENYYEKTGLSDFLINIKNHKSHLFYTCDSNDENSPFIEEERIGITKGKDGQTQENAFYKQIVYKMGKGFYYAFNVEFSEEIKNLNSLKTVVMGAEKSPFSIEFKPIDKNIEDEIKFSPHNSPKVVLISDAYYAEDPYKTSIFAVAQTKPFRYLKTSVKNTQNYSHFDFKKNQCVVSRSDRLNLLKRGSVFYFDTNEKADAFKKALEEYANFYKIGYNHSVKL